MPVGSDAYASAKQGMIQEISKQHDIEVHFPRYLLEEPHFDLNSTIEEMAYSLFIVADLTLERPSCYYELGIAEAIGKPVYLIAQHGTSIHQTASRSSVRFYNDLNELRTLLSAIIESAD